MKLTKSRLIEIIKEELSEISVKGKAPSKKTPSKKAPVKKVPTKLKSLIKKSIGTAKATKNGKRAVYKKKGGEDNTPQENEAMECEDNGGDYEWDTGQCNYSA